MWKNPSHCRYKNYIQFWDKTSFKSDFPFLKNKNFRSFFLGNDSHCLKLQNVSHVNLHLALQTNISSSPYNLYSLYLTHHLRQVFFPPFITLQTSVILITHIPPAVAFALWYFGNLISNFMEVCWKKMIISKPAQHGADPFMAISICK